MAEALSGLKRSHYCGEVGVDQIGETVTVMGWAQRRRDLGQLIFIALRDRTGIVQATVDGNTAPAALFHKAESVRGEFVLAIRGRVAARTPENINPDMKTGRIEILVDELRILSESETPPFPIGEDTGVKDDLRLKYRYLDLRRADLFRNIALRHQVVQSVRSFMNDEGFLEIETPILTRSTPEGARDYLVPSRVYPGEFYALPQSPQLFKQLLMVSGMDRYYQIARCFRDEDLRADRQPEFTQIDMELSFIEMEDILSLNERLISKVFAETLGETLETPFLRLTWKEAMERFGSDKPDMRFGMELQNVSEVVAGTDFVVFQSALAGGGSVRGINATGQGHLPRKQLDALGEFVKTYKAKGLAYVIVQEDGSLKSPLAKFFAPEKLQELVDAMGGKPGDLLLFVADAKNQIVFDALGALRLEMARRMDLLDPNVHKFLWVTEFPMLEWDEEENRFVAVHHPFTAPMDEDVPLLDTDPGAVRAKAYDMVLNGVELGGGSIRIHQADVQQKMFSLLGFTPEQAQARFGFLLRAFQYGVPPHGGLAFGLDRMVMLICGASTIRDVIAFPKVKDASCPMTEAPNVVDPAQLAELGLEVAAPAEEAPKD